MWLPIWRVKLYIKSDGDFVRLPLQTYMNSATAITVVQSLVYSFAK